MVEMGLVRFTSSKQYGVACLEDISFEPKTKSIVWKIEKTLKIGTWPPITTVTEKTVVRNVEEEPKLLSSMGIATTYANSHNVDKLTETLEQCKGKIAEMKEVLRKEERVGMKSKKI